jgi:bifunctional DNA-binding transcriptional regulator/antitoxin component of YhaV-PrlF toxin-antitoxin module
MTSILDDKRRGVLPEDIADELGLVEGSAVAFKREKGFVTLKKAKEREDSLRETILGPQENEEAAAGQRR